MAEVCLPVRRAHSGSRPCMQTHLLDCLWCGPSFVKPPQVSDQASKRQKAQAGSQPGMRCLGERLHGRAAPQRFGSDTRKERSST
jgi:hypothetical protein